MNSNDINNGINQILQNSIPEKQSVYRLLLGLLDLTTLEGTDTDDKVRNLCHRGISVANPAKKIPAVAAICVYPNFAATAKKALGNSGINVACVAGAFPSGQSPLFVRLAEVEDAVMHGADEIDMVISRGSFIEGNEAFLAEEVKQHKIACGQAHLKVILETGELSDPQLIYKASMIAMENGADFIKTSTGKIQPAATLEAAYVMLHAIREFYHQTGRKIGFKPAGGISDADTALKYYLLVRDILGDEWLNKQLFRIGASRLLQSLLDVTE